MRLAARLLLFFGASLLLCAVATALVAAQLQIALDEPKRALMLGLFYAALNAAVFFGLGAFWLRGAVLRPLQRMVDTVERAADGELARAIEGAGAAGDPLGQLGFSLRRMLEELRAREALLRTRLTELERAQEELVRSERLASVGRLAAGLAHEVGNPLAAAAGLLELAQDPREDEATRADCLRRARTELTRIEALLRSLLDFARPSVPAALAPTDLAEVAREGAELVRRQKRFEGVALRVEVDAAAPRAWADSARLHQVVLNLLLNAADAVATLPDGVARRVDVRVGQSGGAPWLEVSDSGPGVPEAARARVFEPFFSTKGAGRGTGLGLAVSVQLVEGMGGRLVLAPAAVGEGACFRMTLRAAAAA